MQPDAAGGRWFAVLSITRALSLRGLTDRPVVLLIEGMLVEFRDSPIHGTGGFAITEISAGTPMIEYLGRRVDRVESLRQRRLNNACLFCLDPEAYLDGSVSWNPARFLNHSCDPNAEAELISGRIWIVARRNICAGEEITFDYGYDRSSYRKYPCRCGAPNCVGYIVGEVLRSGAR